MTIAGAPTMLVCAWWAFAPLPKPPPLPVLQTPPAPIDSSPLRDETIDLRVFAANLWKTPSQVVEDAMAKAPEPPKPLNIQLIGIIHDPVRGFKAAVYDADNDRLLILASGDQIFGHAVRSVTDQGIELTDGRSTRRLALKQSPT